MQIVALYKTFDGEEWIGASLASIYDHVDKIVMVHGRRSWTGEEDNRVKPVVAQWRQWRDTQNKIIEIDTDETTQELQYAAAFGTLDRLRPDIVWIVDCDEVWAEPEIMEMRRGLADAEIFPAYRASMQTYVKLPFYRVAPPYGEPMTFFRDWSWLAKSPRGNKAPSRPLEGAWFHHFTYVRRDWTAVERKLRGSCAADRGEQIVANWKEAVWDRLPYSVTQLHAFQRWRAKWDHIKPIWLGDIPEAARETALSFLPPGDGFCDGEEMVLAELACGNDLVVDLGTYRGRSAAILSLGAKRVVSYDVYEDVLWHQCKQDELDADSGYADRYESSQFSLCDVASSLLLFSNVELRQGLTSPAAADFPADSVDLVFVDADHSYDGCRSDYVSWLRPLKSGGIMLFHDCSDFHPGPQRLCRELESAGDCVQTMELPPYCGTLRAFRKV